MIEAKGLTKRFGQVLAVDGVTFSAQPGEVTGFLGRNGAGKVSPRYCVPAEMAFPAVLSWVGWCGVRAQRSLSSRKRRSSAVAWPCLLRDDGNSGECPEFNHSR